VTVVLSELMTTHPSPVAAVATAGTSEAPSSVASRASGPAADATPGRISSAMAALHRDIRKRIVSSSSQFLDAGRPRCGP